MRRTTGVLILVGGIVLLAGAGAVLTVTGFLPKMLGMAPPPGTVAAEAEKSKPKEPLTAAMFYDMPPQVVSLDTRGRGNRILQLGVSLQMSSAADVSAIRFLQPRLSDVLQVYVRELPIEETSSADRLASHRAELLARINAAIAPLVADEVFLRQVQQQ